MKQLKILKAGFKFFVPSSPGLPYTLQLLVAMRKKRETVGLFFSQLMFLFVLTPLTMVLAISSPASTPVTTRVEGKINICSIISCREVNR
ncbi:MAG: hypothetical protein ACK518_03290 [bacterium]